MIKTEKSKKLFEVAKKYIPQGVNSGVRAWQPYPIYIDHGHGSRVYDVDGNEFMDYVMCHGALILGHAHPKLVEAVEEQLKKGCVSFGMGYELPCKVAEKIVKRVPCAEMVRFASSGSEAVQLALRLARAYTGKEKIVKFEGHYHGWFDCEDISVSPPIEAAGLETAPRSIPESFGIPDSVVRDVITLTWNNVEVLENCLERYGHEIAAVITEPAAIHSGCLSPANGYLETMRKLTEKHDIVLIFDEVVTGFRFAFGGAQEYYGITPDLATYGKGLGGGFPIAAVAGKREIMELLERGVAHGGTHNGNSIVVAASLACLTELESEGGKLYKYLFKIGESLKKGLEDAVEDTNVNAIVKGPGPFVDIYFTERDSITTYREALGIHEEPYKLFIEEMRARGVLIRPAVLHPWVLSMVHTEEEISKSIEYSYEALRETKKQYEMISPS